jgi:diaminopimelate epimerase
MKFTKMHGAGNDYVLLDGRDQERDWSALARDLCDRHFGVGADGLLLVAPSTEADIRMRMWNPDGSEAEMCGNGIRCFAKYVVEREILSSPFGAMRIETNNGILDVTPMSDGNGRVTRARVDMGQPRFHATEIPVAIPAGESGLRLDISSLALNITDGIMPEQLVVNYPVEVTGETFRVTCVSVGNPHAVAFIDRDVDQVPLERIGPVIEHHSLFPKRVNFHVVNVEGRGRLKARTWERGAGLTLACGTGACAIQAAARLLRLTDESVEMHMPGGELIVTWSGRGPVYMEGPAVEVFEGEWEE